LNFNPDNKQRPKYLTSFTNDSGLSHNITGLQGNLKRVPTGITADLLLLNLIPTSWAKEAHTSTLFAVSEQ